jgi:hypothetical protein
MATFAPFITETYLKENCPISGNLEIKDIYPFAKTAQDMNIQEVLGTALYDRLMDSLNASPQNYTPNEAVLLKLCRSALVWLTCYHALPNIWIKLRNVGLVKQAGENLTSVDLNEMTFIRSEYNDNATFYLNRLKDYLCENSSLFSEYNEGCWGCENMPANNSRSNSSDIFFDRNDNKKPSYLRFIPNT